MTLGCSVLDLDSSGKSRARPCRSSAIHSMVPESWIYHVLLIYLTISTRDFWRTCQANLEQSGFMRRKFAHVAQTFVSQLMANEARDHAYGATSRILVLATSCQSQCSERFRLRIVKWLNSLWWCCLEICWLIANPEKCGLPPPSVKILQTGT